ncbi:hypothetical protein Hdeb2414_s0006g00223601 [Helianthus debilis subsp. tardiflorus]
MEKMRSYTRYSSVPGTKCSSLLLCSKPHFHFNFFSSFFNFCDDDIMDYNMIPCCVMGAQLGLHVCCSVYWVKMLIEIASMLFLVLPFVLKQYQWLCFANEDGVLKHKGNKFVCLFVAESGLGRPLWSAAALSTK